MKHLISFWVVIVVILIAGCEKQQPTAVDNINPTVQNQNAISLIYDAAKMQKLMDTKLAKLKIMMKQQPESSHPKFLAKKGSIIKVPGDYNTIQEAVDVAADGAVINVTDSYSEDVNIEGKNNITINGKGQAAVTSVGGFAFAVTNCSGVTIKGFMVLGAIMVNTSDGIIIINNDISGPGDGIDIIQSTSCKILSNSIHDNTIGNTGTGDGIFLYDNASNNSIDGNKIFSNHDYDFAATGINIYTGCDNNEIKNNAIWDNFNGISLLKANQNSIKGCKISYNVSTGIVLYENSENELKNNESFRNDKGITIINSSGNQFKNNSTHDNYDGMYFVTDCHENTVINLAANNNSDIGLVFGGNSTTNNTVKNSKASGNGSCDVEDYGTGNIFINNKFGSFNCP